MPSLKQELSYLLLGQPGWKNRINIIELLKERPYNINQMANKLDVSYRTVKHHIGVLTEYDLVITSSSDNYGKVYFLSPRLKKNMGLFNDIKNKLFKITSSPELYQKVIEQTHNGVIILDENKEVIFVNNSAEKITGYSVKNLLGEPLNLFSSTDFLDDRIQELKEGKEIVGIETKISKKSGEEIHVRVTTDIIREEEIIGYSIIITDINMRKKAEKELHMMRNAIENSIVGFAISDLDGNIEYANPELLDMLGYDDGEILGKNIIEFIEEKNRLEDIIEELKEEGSWKGKLTVIDKDEDNFKILSNASIIQDDENESIGIANTVIDINDI